MGSLGRLFREGVEQAQRHDVFNKDKPNGNMDSFFRGFEKKAMIQQGPLSMVGPKHSVELQKAFSTPAEKLQMKQSVKNMANQVTKQLQMG